MRDVKEVAIFYLRGTVTQRTERARHVALRRTARSVHVKSYVHVRVYQQEPGRASCVHRVPRLQRTPDEKKRNRFIAVGMRAACLLTEAKRDYSTVPARSVGSRRCQGVVSLPVTVCKCNTCHQRGQRLIKHSTTVFTVNRNCQRQSLPTRRRKDDLTSNQQRQLLCTAVLSVTAVSSSGVQSRMMGEQ
jgi:hypothetical protein